MAEGTLGFGILGSGNMARVYADALATQVEGGRFVATALGSQALRARGRRIGSRSFESRTMPFFGAETLIVPPPSAALRGGLQRVEYETGVAQLLLVDRSLRVPV